MGDIYDNVIELARRRGFVWPSSECYGAVAGFIDYGPLGAMLKRKIENLWRGFYIIREGYYEIEAPTVGVESIYIASGHVKGFADKMCQCPVCREYHRADHIATDHGTAHADSLSPEALAEIVNGLPCPSCGELMENVDVFYFNLMFQTTIGPGSQRTGYLRPETAQGIFIDFNRLSRFYREKLPFGAVQIGKSYRNEISPRQGMIRLREFTQAEAEIFIHPDHKDHPDFSRYADYDIPLWGQTHQMQDIPPVTPTMRQAVDSGLVANEYVAYYIALTHEFLTQVGINPDKLRFRQHLPTECAHYALDCWDAEIFSERFGWVEAVGIADRTDYDLKAHAKESGDKFSVFVPYDEVRYEKRRTIVPDMGALGPQYRGKAKAVADALIASAPGPDGATITMDKEVLFIPSDLYQIREETVEVRGEEVVPHVVEPSYGIDRILYCTLEHAYEEEDVEGEVRKVLHLNPIIAPIQAAIFPLMNKDGLDTIARDIATDLQKHGFVAQYDDNGAIGRRYRRQDEIGTPYTITVDYDSIEDNTVTLRERDSMQQVRLLATHVPETLSRLIQGTLPFSEAGRKI
jgi:glycyl-tRNA synthetase